MDRRRQDRRQRDDGATAGESKPNRRKTQRRRQIDPTTCERDYSNDEIEFMQAMDAYKRSAGRMFPTCSEILEVVRSLGYVRLSEAQLALLEVEAQDHEPEPAALEDEEDDTADLESLET
jgi:hypothetical protein